MLELAVSTFFIRSNYFNTIFFNRQDIIKKRGIAAMEIKPLRLYELRILPLDDSKDILKLID